MKHIANTSFFYGICLDSGRIKTTTVLTTTADNLSPGLSIQTTTPYLAEPEL